ncbi:MAG TPA: hypothetical protein VHC50_07920 [Puia sp.]|nr:hypothetical protein [Puia sp.]
MEESKVKPIRKYRGRAVVLKILQDQLDSGLNVKSYCAAKGIAEGTFHRWKHKHSAPSEAEPVGFATLKVMSESGLFAVVGGIKIYQPVSAAYLKELLS